MDRLYHDTCHGCHGIMMPKEIFSQGVYLSLKNIFPLIESNFESRREGQSRKLSTFQGRTEGENQNEKFSDVL